MTNARSDDARAVVGAVEPGLAAVQASAPPPSPPSSAPKRRLMSLWTFEPSRWWIQSYIRRLWWTDAIVVILAVSLAQWLRFGSLLKSTPNGGTGVPAGVTSLVIVVAWMFALRVLNTRDRRIVGAGASEYSRVATASFTVFGVAAIASLLLKLDLARGFIAIVLPLGTIGLLVTRALWRRGLTRSRLSGRHLERVLVVGSRTSAEALIDRMTPAELGYSVAGVCIPEATSASAPEFITVAGKDVPVLGDLQSVSIAVTATGATTVAVSSASVLGHSAMQELSWDLHGMDVDMIVSPGVLDVAGPRMLMRPVAGLPLLHIDKPRFEGATKLRKAAVDRVGASLILLTVAPLLILVAIAIKLDSKGPVFYRGSRVGIGNVQFGMWKFRSMVQNADAQKNDLLDQNEGAGPMFKMVDDPRVTRVGSFIRRYSIDELPQLFNVLGGTMSLVGPRPPLPSEVQNYDGRVARRMLVKPGMTGLWQISGRSDLPWDEAVRLDLSYVENWSITQDLVILWRTGRAVFAREGAY